MAIGLGEAAGAAVGLVPSLYKLFTGIGQTRRANRINPQDPGFVMNQGVLNNAQVLSDRASNYRLPGYGNTLNNIGAAGASAFNSGVQGASSGDDVLDLATKIAYGQGQQVNQLGVQNAMGADQALLQSLDANADAGRQYQAKNQYDISNYQAKLREKAALLQGGNENTYGGLDTLATIGTTLLNPRKIANTGQQYTPEQLQAQQAYLKTLKGQ